MRVVIDTNIIVASCLKQDNYARKIIRLCLQERIQPIMGIGLFLEMEDVFSRDKIFERSILSGGERNELLDAFLSVCEWCKIYYSWRPNLRDENDNHIYELAIAGAADFLITSNIRDFKESEIKFPSPIILDARQFIEGYFQ